MAKELKISHGSFHEIIHYRLHVYKVCARWVRKQLMEQHRHDCLDICNHLSDQYNEESSCQVAPSLVTKHGTIATGQTANVRAWNATPGTPPSKIHSNLNQQWEKLCSSHYSGICRDKSLNIIRKKVSWKRVHVYSELMHAKLKLAIQSKRWRQLSKGVTWQWPYPYW